MGEIGTGISTLMSDLTGFRGFLDSYFRGNDTLRYAVEVVRTFEERYTYSTLLRAYSTMPVAPAFMSLGRRERTTSSETTDSTENQSDL